LPGLERLREVREAKALSLAELADRSGLTKNTIYRLEHGAPEPYPSTIRKLAEALGVAPNDLRAPRRA
jgi:transcriptional regulator with XRE-family HTH domain